MGLVACQGEGATNSSDIPLSFAVGDATTSTPEFGKIKVCKSATSNVSGTFTIGRTAVGASTGSVSASPITIAPGACVVVAEDAGGSGVGSNVTVTETSTGLQGVSAQRIDAATGVTNETVSNGDTRFLNSFHGFAITFHNMVDEPTETGINGCSPGYYKNHAFPAPFTKTTTFNSVFGGNVYGSGATLQSVLSAGGGGLNALGRQTVAAYLNATIYSDFGYTPAEVIAAFNTAVAGSTADRTALQKTFEALTDVDGRICTNPTGK